MLYNLLCCKSKHLTVQKALANDCDGQHQHMQRSDVQYRRWFGVTKHTPYSTRTVRTYDKDRYVTKRGWREDSSKIRFIPLLTKVNRAQCVEIAYCTLWWGVFVPLCTQVRTVGTVYVLCCVLCAPVSAQCDSPGCSRES